MFGIVLVAARLRRSVLDNGGGRAPDHRRRVSAGVGTVEVGAMAGEVERTTGTVCQWRNEGIGFGDDDGG
jgi:hypothetical protein